MRPAFERTLILSSKTYLMREPYKDYFIFILFNFEVDYMFILGHSI